MEGPTACRWLHAACAGKPEPILRGSGGRARLGSRGFYLPGKLPYRRRDRTARPVSSRGGRTPVRDSVDVRHPTAVFKRNRPGIIAMESTVKVRSSLKILQCYQIVGASRSGEPGIHKHRAAQNKLRL